MRVQEVKDISGALAALVSMSSTPGGAASKDDDSTDGETRGAHRPFKRWESENKENMRLMRKLTIVSSDKQHVKAHKSMVALNSALSALLGDKGFVSLAAQGHKCQYEY